MQINARIQQAVLGMRGYVNIGDTPLVRFSSLSTDQVEVLGKLEWMQAGGSVKARAADQIIWLARENRLLRDGMALLDASSGNTAIAYATILKHMGLRTVICLPSNASAKRIRTLEALGAELVFTSPFEGTEGAQVEARKLYEEHQSSFFYADQYSNPANWQAHYQATAAEIIEQTDSKLTHFVAGLGTTGTFTGTVRRLKALDPSIRAIALQPDSPMHGLEGWKHLETASVPRIFDPTLEDARLEVASEDAYEMIRYIAHHEGYLISPSSAANLVGAHRVAQSLKSGKVVTILPDSLERYEEVSELIFGKSFE